MAGWGKQSKEEYNLYVEDVEAILGIGPIGVENLARKGTIKFKKSPDPESKRYVYDRSSVYKYKRMRLDKGLPLPKNFMGSGLTIKQALFVENYLSSFDLLKSYEEAGYSDNTRFPRSNARRLLRLSKVRNAIVKRTKKRLFDFNITQEMVLKEIIRLAFSDISNVTEWNNEEGIMIKPSFMLDENITSSIQEISSVEGPHGRNIKVKLHDKQKSLATLCKYVGIVDGDNTFNNLNVFVDLGIDDIEQQMKDRNIPIPIIGIKDFIEIETSKNENVLSDKNVS